jgi:hypothetical protein
MLRQTKVVLGVKPRTPCLAGICFFLPCPLADLMTLLALGFLCTLQDICQPRTRTSLIKAERPRQQLLVLAYAPHTLHFATNGGQPPDSRHMAGTLSFAAALTPLRTLIGLQGCIILTRGHLEGSVGAPASLKHGQLAALH